MDDSFSDRYFQLIEYNKKQLIVLLDPIVDIHYANFQQTEIYSKIHGLTRTLNYAEQDVLGKEVRNHFGTFIYDLSRLCPKITRTEIIVCCLSLRFPIKKSLCVWVIFLPIRSENTNRELEIN